MKGSRTSPIWPAALFLAAACSSSPAPVPPRPALAIAPDPAPASSAIARVATAAKRDRFAVATENQAALDVAVSVLERGGTAIDAAVAGVLAGGVAQPSSTGLGGDGFALTWAADTKKAEVIDFRAVAPHGLRRRDHLSRNTEKKKRGAMVGVPGLVAGLALMHRRGGKTPWSELVALAADVAEKGAVVTPYTAEALGWMAHDNEVALGAMGRTDGGAGAAHAGDTLKQPALGVALRTLAEQGPDAFYKGALGRDVVDAAREAGSAMTLADLSGYAAIVREPLAIAWEGFDVRTVPSPSGGGVMLGELLGLFSKADLVKLGLDSPSYVHLISEGQRTALADRQLFVGDPAYTKADPSELLDPARLRSVRASFAVDATHMPKLRSIAEGGTFHLSVIDEAGNAVSITATLTDMFGSRVVTRSGFALNDALVDFTMDDYGQRAYSRGPNFARGGARPAASMTPTIVLKDGRAAIVLGASGGLRAPSSIAEVLFALSAFDRPLRDAVSRPRAFVDSGGALLIDPGLAPIADDLRGRGEVVDAKRANFGAISAVTQRFEGGVRVLGAEGDARKNGVGTVGSEPRP